MSTESIASSSRSVGGAESCAGCGAPLADDQRYCLQCGERRTPMSSVLLGGPPGPAAPAAMPPGVVSPSGAPPGQGASSSNTVTVIAGVGVLLLAMGVGVLIGRAGTSKQSAAPAQVITVGSAPSSSASGAASEAFTDSWPAGTSGYTVQLQTLPQSGTLVSAVEAAKTAAAAKGATSVGALKSEDFSSLTPGNYVIYSGVYHKRAEAQKALASLKKSFPASVISVSNSGAGSSAGAGTSSGGSAGISGSGGAAKSKVLQKLSTKKGKSYEQESKNLPNEILTP